MPFPSPIETHRTQHRLAFLLVVLALAFSPALFAAAAEPCPDGSRGVPGGDLEAYEAKLAAQVPACNRDAAFLAWHGAILNRLGRPQAAADQLERALLLAPELMGARIDYADALAAKGEVAAARDLLQQVLRRPDLPAASAESIKQRLAQSEPLLWRKEGSVTLWMGHDSNLNSATRASDLALTLPGGELVLPLNGQSRAQGGTSQIVEAAGQAILPFDQGQHLHLYADLAQRHSPSQIETDTDYRQINIAALWRRPWDAQGSETSVSLGYSDLAYDPQQRYHNLRLILARDWAQVPPCRPLLGADLERRSYPGNQQLNNHYLGVQGGVACGLAIPVKLLVGAGREIAEANRPGGDAWRLDARLLAHRPLGPGLIEADLLYTLQRDDDGYSPLLDNGARRRMQRLAARLEYQQALAPGWQGLLTLEASRQYANLALFDIRGQAIHLGLRWRW